MKKTIGLVSLLALSITNSMAGVVNFTKLNESEQEFIATHLDNDLIKYDAATDEIIIDKDLEKQLRNSGILSTQDAVKSVICEGDEG